MARPNPKLLILSEMFSLTTIGIGLNPGGIIHFSAFNFPYPKDLSHKKRKSYQLFTLEVRDRIIYTVQLHLIKWLTPFHLFCKYSHLLLISLKFCHFSQTGIYYCSLTLIYLWNDLHGFCQCYLHVFIINTSYLGADLIYECLACMPCYLVFIFDLHKGKEYTASSCSHDGYIYRLVILG